MTDKMTVVFATVALEGFFRGRGKRFLGETLSFEKGAGLS